MNKLHIIILLICCSCLMPASSLAQNAYRENDKMMFNHLAIGGSVGTTGLGFDVVMPATEHFAIHAGFSTLPLGALTLNIANNMGDIIEALDLPHNSVFDQMKDKSVKMAVAFNMYTAHLLADYYPWHSSEFHITAGVKIGNPGVFHIYNTEDGSMAYLNECQQLVDDYNASFDTRYPPFGLQFGDYVLTADENGNVDAKMKVWVVRPYYGIGWGRNVNVTARRSVNVDMDFGLEHWGTPKFDFNKGEKVVSTASKDGGVFKFLSGLKAWPVLKLTISGEIF